MPTFDVESRFWRDYARLTSEQRTALWEAVRLFIAALRANSFPPALRVKRFQSESDTWEMTWAADGRALFRYGEEIRPGETHVVWIRVGTHDIFRKG